MQNNITAKTCREKTDFVKTNQDKWVQENIEKYIIPKVLNHIDELAQQGGSSCKIYFNPHPYSFPLPGIVRVSSYNNHVGYFVDIELNPMYREFICQCLRNLEFNAEIDFNDNKPYLEVSW